MDTPSIPPTMRCKKCGKEYPLTPEYWQRNSEMRTGFRNECKACLYAASRKRALQYPEKTAEYKRNYRERDPERDKAQRQAHRDKHRESRNAKNREYYQRTKEAKAQYQKEYREKNRERLAKRDKEYRQRVREHTKVYRDEYRKRKPFVEKATIHRRLARKRALPNDFTAEQWEQCLEYWSHRCAVCGAPIDMFTTLAIDHWIPLSDPRPDNPGTVAFNILPLCHNTSGLKTGCNRSKSAHDPIEWLVRALGKRKAKRKLAEIEAYFSFVRQRDSE